MQQRAILHSDMNSFYASVEAMLDPTLKGKAVAVCGSTEDRHGIVLAKSELAKKAVAVLGGQFDIEIVEKHHNQKLDAPSGTALMLADAINATGYTFISATSEPYSGKKGLFGLFK